jgi:hypothetical protein
VLRVLRKRLRLVFSSIGARRDTVDRTGPYFFKFQILPCEIRVIKDITVCQWALRPLASTSYVISPLPLGSQAGKVQEINIYSIKAFH